MPRVAVDAKFRVAGLEAYACLEHWSFQLVMDSAILVATVLGLKSYKNFAIFHAVDDLIRDSLYEYHGLLSSASRLEKGELTMLLWGDLLKVDWLAQGRIVLLAVESAALSCRLAYGSLASNYH